MKIAVISDVHGKWNKIKVPECDILISCGDYSFRGESHMVRDFHDWLDKQPAKHIISVQGNHELWVEENFDSAKSIAEDYCPRVHFVQEGLVAIEGLKIWCSAWTPYFYNWAWNAQRGEEIKRHWDLITDDVDILVTHGPSYGVRDLVVNDHSPNNGERVGCKDLTNRIKELKNLKAHFFGHIHRESGYEHVGQYVAINAAMVGEDYRPHAEKPFMVTIIGEDYIVG